MVIETLNIVKIPWIERNSIYEYWGGKLHCHGHYIFYFTSYICIVEREGR